MTGLGTLLLSFQQIHKINSVCKKKNWLKYSAIELEDKIQWSVTWCVLDFNKKKGYPVISTKAVNILLQFSASYVCEQAFSCLTNIKSEERNRLLSVEEELRVCLSKIRPRIQHLYKNKQAQVSHWK
jgi:hypothetical protein